MKAILPSIHYVRGGCNQGNEKKLGDWGFEVDECPALCQKEKINPPAQVNQPSSRKALGQRGAGFTV